VQGSSASRFRMVLSFAGGRDGPAPPMTPSFARRGARLEPWLASGAALVVFFDVALWLGSGAAGSLAWLAYGVAACALGLVLVVLAGWRLRQVRSRARSAAVAGIGRARSGGGRVGMPKAASVPYSPWLFRELLREEIERSAADERQLGVVVVRVGDEATFDAERHGVVEAGVCAVAHEGRRGRGLAGQLGAGEFALCLPETDFRGALVAGARLTDLFDELTGVSVGAAAFPEDGQSPEELVDAARGRALPNGDAEMALPA